MTTQKSLFINTKLIKSVKEARLAFGTMILNACKSPALKSISSKVSCAIDIYVSEETGNEYYGVRVTNKYGKTVTTIPVGSWNVNGKYAFSEKFTGNVGQVVNKIKDRVTWIAMNSPERFLKKYSGELTRTGFKRNPLGEELTKEELDLLAC